MTGASQMTVDDPEACERQCPDLRKEVIIALATFGKFDLSTRRQLTMTRMIVQSSHHMLRVTNTLQ